MTVLNTTTMPLATWSPVQSAMSLFSCVKQGTSEAVKAGSASLAHTAHAQMSSSPSLTVANTVHTTKHPLLTTIETTHDDVRAPLAAAPMDIEPAPQQVAAPPLACASPPGKPSSYEQFKLYSQIISNASILVSRFAELIFKSRSRNNINAAINQDGSQPEMMRGLWGNMHAGANWFITQVEELFSPNKTTTAETLPDAKRSMAGNQAAASYVPWLGVNTLKLGINTYLLWRDRAKRGAQATQERLGILTDSAANLVLGLDTVIFIAASKAYASGVDPAHTELLLNWGHMGSMAGGLLLFASSMMAYNHEQRKLERTHKTRPSTSGYFLFQASLSGTFIVRSLEQLRLSGALDFLKLGARPESNQVVLDNLMGSGDFHVGTVLLLMGMFAYASGHMIHKSKKLLQKNTQVMNRLVTGDPKLWQDLGIQSKEDPCYDKHVSKTKRRVLSSKMGVASGAFLASAALFQHPSAEAMIFLPYVLYRTFAFMQGWFEFRSSIDKTPWGNAINKSIRWIKDNTKK
jgi:hypothetical protein